MDKKEFLKKEDNLPPLDNLDADIDKGGGALKAKLAHFSQRLFGIIKLLLGVSLLPFVYGSTVSFLNEFAFIEKSLQSSFWSGLISLLIIYLFVWEPKVVYLKGHRLLEIIFSFFKPLVKVAPYLLPVYTLVLFALYGILSYFVKSPQLINNFAFLFGFSIALHLIFSAKSIRGKKDDFLKGNYIFGFSFIYILNVILLAFCLNLIFDKFSFVKFSNQSFQIASGVFYAVFKQLFL